MSNSRAVDSASCVRLGMRRDFLFFFFLHGTCSCAVLAAVYVPMVTVPPPWRCMHMIGAALDRGRSWRLLDQLLEGRRAGAAEGGTDHGVWATERGLVQHPQLPHHR